MLSLQNIFKEKKCNWNGRELNVLPMNNIICGVISTQTCERDDRTASIYHCLSCGYMYHTSDIYLQCVMSPSCFAILCIHRTCTMYVRLLRDVVTVSCTQCTRYSLHDRFIVISILNFKFVFAAAQYRFYYSFYDRLVVVRRPAQAML